MVKQIFLLACLFNLSFTVPALAASAMNQGSNATVPFIDATQGGGDAAATGMAFKLNGTEMMRVTATGSVGIGTANPVSRLEINTAQVSPASVANGIRINETTGGYGVNIGAGSNYGWIQGLQGFLTTSGNNNIAIQPNGGNVGIGTTTPSQKLEVYGNIFTDGSFISNMPGTHGAASYVCNNGIGYFDACSSLRKFKKDIQPLTLGLDAVIQLQPVSYKWKADGTPDIGFIAEDAVKVNPVLGEKGTNGKLSGVRYAHMVAVLAKAIQEIKVLFDTDHDTLIKLKTENNNLRDRLEKLEARVK